MQDLVIQLYNRAVLNELNIQIKSSWYSKMLPHRIQYYTEQQLNVIFTIKVDTNHTLRKVTLSNQSFIINWRHKFPTNIQINFRNLRKHDSHPRYMYSTSCQILDKTTLLLDRRKDSWGFSNFHINVFGTF